MTTDPQAPLAEGEIVRKMLADLARRYQPSTVECGWGAGTEVSPYGQGVMGAVEEIKEALELYAMAVPVATPTQAPLIKGRDVYAHAESSDDPISAMLRSAAERLDRDPPDVLGAKVSLHGAHLAWSHTALATARAIHPASDALGSWMSAALDDPNVCAEMKADVQAWFDAGQPLATARAAGDGNDAPISMSVMRVLIRLSLAADEVNGEIDRQIYDENSAAGFDLPDVHEYDLRLSAKLIRDMNDAICAAQQFIKSLHEPHLATPAEAEAAMAAEYPHDLGPLVRDWQDRAAPDALDREVAVARELARLHFDRREWWGACTKAERTAWLVEKYWPQWRNDAASIIALLAPAQTKTAATF